MSAESHLDGAGPKRVLNICELPPEVLLDIFDCVVPLNKKPPSEVAFDNHPTADLCVDEDNRRMKLLSVVCRHWRKLIFTRLFRYCKVQFSTTSFPNPLGNYWTPPIEGNLTMFLNFVIRNELGPSVRGLFLFTEQPMPCCRPRITTEVILQRNCNSRLAAWWHSIFDVVQPSIIHITAPPSTLHTLTYGKVSYCLNFGKEKELCSIRVSSKRPAALQQLESDLEWAPRDPMLPDAKSTFPNCLLDWGPWTSVQLNFGLATSPLYNGAEEAATFTDYNKLVGMIQHHRCVHPIEEATLIMPFPFPHIFRFMAAGLVKIPSLRHLTTRILDLNSEYEYYDVTIEYEELDDYDYFSQKQVKQAYREVFDAMRDVERPGFVLVSRDVEPNAYWNEWCVWTHWLDDLFLSRKEVVEHVYWSAHGKLRGCWIKND